MNIQSFIQDQVLLPRLKERGLLVVYDRDRRYRELCLGLATETRRMIDAGASSIEAREAAIATLQKLGTVDANWTAALCGEGLSKRVAVTPRCRPIGMMWRVRMSFVLPFQGVVDGGFVDPGRRFAAVAATLCPGLIC